MKTREPWPVDLPFPAAMTDSDLMRVLQWGHSRFYAMKKAGKLARFAIKDPVGVACWSGKKVQAYVDGEPESYEFKGKSFSAGRRAAEASA